jgi:hypothetical protein
MIFFARKLKKTVSNSKLRKSKKNCTMKRGGMISSRRMSQSRSITSASRKSQRGLLIMPQFSFGKGNVQASFGELNAVVQQIQPGPQIVTDIVISHEGRDNEQHAFLVDVQDDKIMISDWGGRANYMTNDEDWNQYKTFMRALQQKFRLPIEYYDVDKTIRKTALKHHCTFNNSGGCSNYIYAWAHKKFGETYAI